MGQSEQFRELLGTSDPLPAADSYGPAMRRLNERQQKFVLALLDQGGRNQMRAALRAGYETKTSNALINLASRLAHTPKVQDAILEESRKRAGATTLLATSRLVEMIEGEMLSPRDQLKAIGMLLDRVGMPAATEHKVSVEHSVNEADLKAKAERLMEKYNLDPSRLLAPATPLEVVEVKAIEGWETLEGLEGLEDVLGIKS